MHDLAFADATRPTPVAVLQLPLRPYSLGHELLLLQKRNPFVLLDQADFAALTAADQRKALIEAVNVCSHTWAQNHLEQDSQTQTRWQAWKLRRWWCQWLWRIRWLDWDDELIAFQDYLATSHAGLRILSSEIPEDAEAYQIANQGETLGGGRSLGGPFAARLLLFVISELQPLLRDSNCGPYDFPYALAANLYFVHLENDGHVVIENHREAEERAAMAQHRLDAKKERESEAKANPPTGDKPAT